MMFRTTLRSLAALSTLVLTCAAASAQTDYSAHSATDGLTVGLSFSGGVTMTTDATENYKVAPVFSYKTGVDATYPLTNTIYATLGLGLDHRGGRYYWYRDDAIWETRMVDYFSINPGIRFSAFYIGLNLGVPLGGTRTWQNGLDAKENEFEIDSDVDDLNFMIEPQIGAMIPLLDEEIGWLGLLILAGYSVNDISGKTDFLPGQTTVKPVSTQMPSLRMGITWQFGIPGTHK